MGTVMLRRLVVGSTVVEEDTSPSLLIPWYNHTSVAVIMRGRSSRSDTLNLGCCSFPIIFDLDCG